MLVRFSLPLSPLDLSVLSIPLRGISLFWGPVAFLLSFFFQITPSPAALCLHPSCCVLLTPEVFVSFDTSSSLLPRPPALCSSDLLQHSSLCHPFTFFVPYILLPPPLIHQFLPSTTLPLYPFHIAFLLISFLGIFYHCAFSFLCITVNYLFHSLNFSLITLWFLLFPPFRIDFPHFLCTSLMSYIFLSHVFIAPGFPFPIILFTSEIFHHLPISASSFYPPKLLSSGKTMMGLKPR